MLCKNGKQTRDFRGVFILFLSIFLYFGGVFNKTIIPFALVGYEIGPRWLFTISYPTCAHGIIVNYSLFGFSRHPQLKTILYQKNWCFSYRLILG